jgi:16S rRNA (adenine1518-N6/adenine1519-N6)-dimethyltransferase
VAPAARRAPNPTDAAFFRGATSLPIVVTGPVQLLGAADVRRLAAELDLRPTRQRGQNFVIDANTVRRIVRESGVDLNDIVVEVGPGLGSLTLALLEVADRVVAIEVDRRLAAQLPATIAAHAGDRADRCEVVEADALRVDGVPGPPPTALVANLPYNVSVPVLLHLLTVLPSLEKGLVMVQAEVADRLAAPPGSRTYGVPSVKAAWFADVRRAGAVGRNVFWPAPNVDSGLVAWTRREPPATTATREQVFTVVDAAFAQRRKTLRGALARLAGSAPAAEDALRAAGVDPTARGEVLDVTAFARIAEALASTPRKRPEGALRAEAERFRGDPGNS